MLSPGLAAQVGDRRMQLSHLADERRLLGLGGRQRLLVPRLAPLQLLDRRLERPGQDGLLGSLRLGPGDAGLELLEALTAVLGSALGGGAGIGHVVELALQLGRAGFDRRGADLGLGVLLLDRREGLVLVTHRLRLAGDLGIGGSALLLEAAQRGSELVAALTVVRVLARALAAAGRLKVDEGLAVAASALLGSGSLGFGGGEASGEVGAAFLELLVGAFDLVTRRLALREIAAKAFELGVVDPAIALDGGVQRLSGLGAQLDVFELLGALVSLVPQAPKLALKLFGLRDRVSRRR